MFLDLHSYKSTSIIGDFLLSSSYLGSAWFAFVSRLKTFDNSRRRFRWSILRCRCLANLALSPLFSDTCPPSRAHHIDNLGSPRKKKVYQPENFALPLIGKSVFVTLFF